MPLDALRPTCSNSRSEREENLARQRSAIQFMSTVIISFQQAQTMKPADDDDDILKHGTYNYAIKSATTSSAETSAALAYSRQIMSTIEADREAGTSIWRLSEENFWRSKISATFDAASEIDNRLRHRDEITAASKCAAGITARSSMVVSAGVGYIEAIAWRGVNRVVSDAR